MCNIIIDRNRQSEADFVECHYKGVGFIARVYTLPESRRDEFMQSLKEMPWPADDIYLITNFNDSEVVLEIVEMLPKKFVNPFRRRALMKSAMQAYLSSDDTPGRQYFNIIEKDREE